MPDEHDEATEHAHHHHHACANLFGCGDEQGTGVVREDIKDAAFDAGTSDRLLHMDEVDQENLDGYLSARGRWRRKFLRASSFMGVLAARGRGSPSSRRRRRRRRRGRPKPITAKAACMSCRRRRRPCASACSMPTLAPILTIESGDTISFPDTWSHFLNEMQPGVPIDTLAKLRVSNPGKGPHSIIGPIAVNKAEPGDVLEIRYKRISPFEWGAVFNNPGSLGTGLLAAGLCAGADQIRRSRPARHEGQVHAQHHRALEALSGHPRPGAARRLFPAAQPRCHQLGAPGPARGQSSISASCPRARRSIIPVWKPGALIYTGDSHAVQGDGEISLTALETRMKELRIQVILHKQKNLAWPVAETHTHWIIMGLDKDLNAAMTLAARNAIKFLASRAKISELDAYALCSIAVSFRVTQVVDIVRGVHALIPKSLFADDLRRQMTMV